MYILTLFHVYLKFVYYDTFFLKTVKEDGDPHQHEVFDWWSSLKYLFVSFFIDLLIYILLMMYEPFPHVNQCFLTYRRRRCSLTTTL